MRDWIGFALRRFLRGGWRLVLAAAMMFAASAADAALADLAVFLAAYRCDVVERLSMIRADRTPKDRYLILAIKEGPRGYVQCLFVENDSRLLCEAESGFYAQAVGQPRAFRVTPEGIAALARLGFSTDDSEGNYQRLIPLNGADAFAEVADVVLTALFEAYGARLDSKLQWEAPLAPGKGLFARCSPVS
jgi:hypothetical protein